MKFENAVKALEWYGEARERVYVPRSSLASFAQWSKRKRRGKKSIKEGETSKKRDILKQVVRFEPWKDQVSSRMEDAIITKMDIEKVLSLMSKHDVRFLMTYAIEGYDAALRQIQTVFSWGRDKAKEHYERLMARFNKLLHKHDYIGHPEEETAVAVSALPEAA